jgi:hypothetical protein
MSRSAVCRKAALVILVLALSVGLSSCFYFKGTLTIYNESSHDLDFVQWADDWNETIEFGDDSVWDVDLAAFTPGILHGSSSTRKVFSGTDFIYFYYADQFPGEFRRTVEPVTVGGFENVSFTFTDSTPSITLSFSPSDRNERGLSGSPAVTGGVPDASRATGIR